MTPMVGVSKRAFKRMGTGSNYFHLFLNRPFSRLMDQSSPKGISIFSQHKKSLIFDLSIKSLKINVYQLRSYLVEDISTIYYIYLFDLT